jgi:quercetin dioxygenase-like cupin family protein
VLSRREAALLVPALFALPLRQGGADVGTSATFRNEDIAPTVTGPLTSRQMLRTHTHANFRLDLHESELPPGLSPHDPHQHLHEELLLIRAGELDVTIAGRTTRLAPGSAAYFASNQVHGWKNVSSITARYFVLALGDDA